MARKTLSSVSGWWGSGKHKHKHDKRATDQLRDTVSEQSEDNEVDGGEHAAVDAALRLDPVIHHCVPVLPGEDLQEKHRPVSESGPEEQAEWDVKTKLPGKP